MVGGGQFGAFLNVKKFDEELIVRSCQVHALMPMMQFSVAPWRILSKANVAICAKYAHLHQQMGDYILELAKHASKTGEPIVRHMEYQYPHQGFIRWKDDRGKVFKGPRTMTIDVPLERLPYFEKLTK